MLAALVVATVAAVSGGARACGGFFCSLQNPVVQAGENILFVQEGDDVIATVQISYSGDAEDFSWVLPLPSTPSEFSTSSDNVFRALHATTDPQFIVNMQHPKDCEFAGVNQCEFLASATGGGGGGGGDADDGVDVLAMGEVGPFVYSVIAASSSDRTGQAVFNYLNENGFDQPAEARTIVARYQSLKHRFVTLKLQKGKSVGELVPIVIKYKAPSDSLSCIPLRLTKVAATDAMPVFAWVAGEHRVVPQNFVHLDVDFRDMMWHRCASSGGFFGGFFGGPGFNPFGGNNACDAEYKELLKRTAAKFDAGKWITTEYAGELPEGLLDQVWNVQQPSVDRTRLDAATDPGAFLSELLGMLPFDLRQAAPTQALIRRFIPMPAAAADDESCSTEQAFYAPRENNPCFDKYVSAFDSVAFATAVLDELLAPLREARDMLEKHSYLTRLYTQIDVVHMERDPVFRAVKTAAAIAELGDVSNVHTVDGTYACPASAEAEFTVTFTHPGGDTTTIDGVKAGVCGLQWPNVGDDVTILPWPVEVRGGAAVLAATADGDLVRTPVDSAAVYAIEDAKLTMVDEVVGVACTPGETFCSCADNNTCDDANAVCNDESLCLVPTRPTGITTSSGARTPLASAAALTLALVLLFV